MNKTIELSNIADIQQTIVSLIETKGLDISNCERKTLSDQSEWIRIFHHDHKNNTVWFTNYIEALSCSNPDKFSKLYLLDHLRGNDNKYEFILEYPAEFPNQIIRWKQSNNPWRDYNSATGSTYEPVAGYEAVQIDIVDSVANRGKGLIRHKAEYNTNDPCLLKGCNNTPYWWYGIGQKAIYDGGLTGPGSVVSIVDLWVRIDNTNFNKVKSINTEISGFVKKPDTKKLQDAIHFLELKFNQNCCESNRCQTCQSNKCESCQEACTCQSDKCEKCQEACTCQSDKCEKCQEACTCQSNKCEKCQEACTQCSNKCEKCQEACSQCSNKCEKCQEACTCQSCQSCQKQCTGNQQSH